MNNSVNGRGNKIFGVVRPIKKHRDFAVVYAKTAEPI